MMKLASAQSAVNPQNGQWIYIHTCDQPLHKKSSSCTESSATNRWIRWHYPAGRIILDVCSADDTLKKSQGRSYTFYVRGHHLTPLPGLHVVWGGCCVGVLRIRGGDRHISCEHPSCLPVGPHEWWIFYNARLEVESFSLLRYNCWEYLFLMAW